MEKRLIEPTPCHLIQSDIVSAENMSKEEACGCSSRPDVGYKPVQNLAGPPGNEHKMTHSFQSKWEQEFFLLVSCVSQTASTIVKSTCKIIYIHLQ